LFVIVFFFSSRRRHTRSKRDWSSDVCSSDLSMPNNQHIEAYEKDDEQFKLFTNILYNQARLIEGLPVEDPVAFTNDMCKVMTSRSEERRVGKEGRSGLWREQ